ncbi:hypothetical protein M2323_003762 [Rhodoblastus acidophilus]|uniref:hypothetical protein n=1 Tax=Rhodoblastus acidophilus TaxID=1074 RepID=UPI0022253A80|nr:hypothetical protein [Rhodoblastus acidophilus]MCW2285925.1 hypothetical protein [Rhodoblastus acidophilus]MCW2334819.1 hypothetical protein [Rhodoblastus acidophilus]
MPLTDEEIDSLMDLIEDLPPEKFGHVFFRATHKTMSRFVGKDATVETISVESWPGESGQDDKWLLCLTAAMIAAHQERS